MTKKILLRVLVWSVIIMLYAPILLLVVYSLSTTKTASLRDFEFGFDLYVELFTTPAIMTAAGNTLLIALVSAFIATIMGTLASVGIMTMKKRFSAATMTLNQVPIVNADIITSFALMLFFVLLGITNNGYLKLIIAHTLICVPFVVLNVLPRMKLLDPNLYEAAQDLGANPVTSLVKVLIPQLLPAMVNGFMLGFALSLDDFIITQYNRDGVHTISTIVYNATRRGVPPVYRALSALIFFAVIAILVLTNILQSKKKKKEIKE